MNDPDRTVIAYARFSPTGRADCESIQTQTDRMQHWCQAYNRDLHAIYHDAELSGADAESRPGLQQALRDVCARRGLLLVYKLDRLARNALDALEIVERLNNRKAAIASVADGFDTSTETGMLFYKLLAIFAEWERQQIGRRTSDSMRRHQAAGRRMGRTDRLPYGYRIDSEDAARHVPDDYEQEVVKQILQMRDAGVSFRKIADRLDEMGYRRRSGGSWAGYHALVQKIVKREAGR